MGFPSTCLGVLYHTIPDLTYSRGPRWPLESDQPISRSFFLCKDDSDLPVHPSSNGLFLPSLPDGPSLLPFVFPDLHPYMFRINPLVSPQDFQTTDRPPPIENFPYNLRRESPSSLVDRVPRSVTVIVTVSVFQFLSALSEEGSKGRLLKNGNDKDRNIRFLSCRGNRRLVGGRVEGSTERK